MYFMTKFNHNYPLCIKSILYPTMEEKANKLT